MFKVKPKYFKITEAHLILLDHAFIEWNDCEAGAPTIGPKRPYGNSDVEQDVCEILGFEVRGEEWESAQLEFAQKLHRETQTALQICLSTRSFKCGTYVSEDICNKDWRMIDE